MAEMLGRKARGMTHNRTSGCSETRRQNLGKDVTTTRKSSGKRPKELKNNSKKCLGGRGKVFRPLEGQ